ncbi:transglycosylase SLT domain protein [Collimonas arenae]|uniref:Transglycosylase SLT domain protein n=1 Tax=Collimonas arenae TaxID=279058 RepID=A0A127QLK6_9BURK|nr:transglycosylase SLT domain protein [Collimonas arenae]AMP10934.1 transglycosylase SLT domain protein [Collimonas arenae]
MLDRIKSFSSPVAKGVTYARDTIGGVIATTRITVLFSGLLAVIAATTLMIKPELAYTIQSLPLFADQSQQKIAPQAAPQIASQPSTDVKSTTSLTVPAPVVASTNHLVHMDSLVNKSIKPVDSSRQQQWVTNWLSKRYRVAGDATNMFVTTAYKTARETKLDPLLILAVMAIESGLNPFAESPVGAQGLMQVMSKVHEDKFESLGGIKAALNPTANIKVGSMILRDYVVQGGSVEAGLKRYVGAAAFANDGGYGYKVLAEYRRLQDVATGKNVPSSGSSAPIATPKPRPIQAVAPVDASATPPEAALSVPDAIDHSVQQSSNKQFNAQPMT